MTFVFIAPELMTELRQVHNNGDIYEIVTFLWLS